MTKISTFNINGIKARTPRLLEWLDETAPDIVCLQEVKSQDKDFPKDMFEKAGYGVIFHGQKSFNGVAILAKGQEPKEIQRGLEGEPEDEQARYLEAEILDKSGNALRVASIYLPNGNPLPGPKFDYKLRWMQRLRNRAQILLNEEIPAILCGDYNVIPRDEDVFSVSAMASDALMQPESRAAYRQYLGDGWSDAFVTKYPAGGVWTYWDYQAGAWPRDNGFRIDHFLLSPIAADRLEHAAVDKEHRGREKASDHAPLWVQLRD
ncbi:exodeoxyribonuclease III [Sphingorhabdus lutea]|uniref:Exodeoxyribonuclease III n=1 Tax=Sphingorhabdus lutea TaxID=1913578 RepID=A0A1L3J9H2_9SPHN|nr:exodeoxyribonuclease III [Sphingorhabdus lutea]APG61774.1 exodeoxyribonuclease III [Sphingorhabdus lutea]